MHMSCSQRRICYQMVALLELKITFYHYIP